MWIAILVIVVLVIAFFITASLSADLMWFDQLHFTGVLLTQWGARAGMFGVGFLAMGIPAWVSITIAYDTLRAAVHANVAHGALPAIPPTK